MHISWLGTTAIKIQTKPHADDIMIVIDPYRPAVGSFPRSLTPNIALYTRGEENSIPLSGTPFVLSTPGECDIKGVLITAVQGATTGETLVRIDTEQMSLGHLGLSSHPLTDAQLEALSEVDILCIPVGGPGSGYDPEAAVKVVNAIEPRVVIPMAFQSDNDPKANPVAAFLKAFGAAAATPETKVILKAKDLPQEETRVIVLAKE